MRFTEFVCVVSLLAASSVSWAASTFIVPTTTLAAQTDNNTSAANSFSTQTNGNLGAGNVSKVDVHSLLYSGETTKVYAHMMVWFGQSNHMNVGYSSTDPSEVKSQIDDMVSRGIDGVVIDWYGSGTFEDQATQVVMQQAEAHPGFTFAIMVDKGAIEWDSCSGCSPQQALISQLQYVEKTYFTSPAYMTVGGVPVVTNFGITDSYPSIDWSAVNSALSTHPLFLFSNNSGFTEPLTKGSYSWVMPTTSDYGMSYLTSFYDTGMGYQSEQTVGATYKGFNDSLASWGSGRVMGQQCGQTWLQTFSKINGLYDSGKQLPDLQLVTWNDYEEGTEIESGIDNCFSVSGSISGNSLKWETSGSESAVDHYTVYISTDGQNLMDLSDLATGNSSLNLCGFPIPNGSYKMFVQAVGKPSMANRITASISYNSTCPVSTPATATVSFSAAPSSLTISAGQSGNLTVVAQPQSGAFNDAISLSCSGLPSGLTCAFSPASITPGASTASSTLTISSASVTSRNVPQGKRFPIYFAWLLPFGLVSLAFGKNLPRGRGLQLLAICALVSVGMVASSCGGGGSKPVTQNPPVTSPSSPSTSSSYTVTIVGSSASNALSTTVNVVVQ
ncbi:MAG TPA: hypothetical protein VGG14_09055 [Candidatus Sulfotelmatobacter sp.]|jgi:hypothetical protein